VVPDDVNYMKAWALLNAHSYKQAWKIFNRPFDDWKAHERPLFNDPAIAISGSYEQQTTKLLEWYGRYSREEVPKVTVQRFHEMESAVKSAVYDWSRYGSRSPQDPVHGAVGFTDASGLFYPSGSDTDRHMFEIPKYQSAIMTNPTEMEAFRQRAYSNSSRIYQFSTDPFTNLPTWTFTWFEMPDFPWPE